MDLIERQAAIEALGERPRFTTGGGYEMGVKEQYDRDLLAIINMPSAQLEREKGHWISKMRSFAGKEYMQCSKCGYTLDLQCLVAYPYFCPGCGAEMRGRE